MNSACNTHIHIIFPRTLSPNPQLLNMDKAALPVRGFKIFNPYRFDVKYGHEMGNCSA